MQSSLVTSLLLGVLAAAEARSMVSESYQISILDCRYPSKVVTGLTKDVCQQAPSKEEPVPAPELQQVLIFQHEKS